MSVAGAIRLGAAAVARGERADRMPAPACSAGTTLRPICEAAEHAPERSLRRSLRPWFSSPCRHHHAGADAGGSTRRGELKGSEFGSTPLSSDAESSPGWSADDLDSILRVYRANLDPEP